MTTNVAIQHPNIFYFVLNANWSSINNLEYWNKGNTATTVNNNTVYKTIYSASPTGYVEPRTAAFTGFTKTGGYATSGFNASGPFNNGWNFYCLPNLMGTTIFFYPLGIRDVWNTDVNLSTGGAIANVFNSGNFWSAGPSGTTTRAKLLCFYSGYVDPQNEDYRAYGFSSRPVSE